MIKKRPTNQIIDSYLDMYNDYKILYEFFGDEAYKNIMEYALSIVKDLSELHKRVKG